MFAASSLESIASTKCTPLDTTPRAWRTLTSRSLPARRGKNRRQASLRWKSVPFRIGGQEPWRRLPDSKITLHVKRRARTVAMNLLQPGTCGRTARTSAAADRSLRQSTASTCCGGVASRASPRTQDGSHAARHSHLRPEAEPWSQRTLWVLR